MKTVLSELELLCSRFIRFPGVGTLKCPTLREAIQNEKKYNTYLNLLSADKNKLLELFHLDNSLFPNNYALFDLIIMNDLIRELFLKLFSFFICETVNHFQSGWVIYKDDKIVGLINSENFESLKNAILKINHVKVNEELSIGNLKSSKAKEIRDKILKGRKSFIKNEESQKPKYLIQDMLSTFCVQSNTYNLTNVLDLTVYQFYNQFERQNIKNQVDILAQKWAAWGKDPFDFSAYYQSLEN